MSKSFLAASPIDQAAARIHRHLKDAAGTDGKLSNEELSATLNNLAPSERGAVDGFYSAVKGKLGGVGHVSMEQISQAIEASRAEATQASAGPDKLSSAELKQVSNAGQAMVDLARKLKGSRGAEMAPIPKEQLAGLQGQELQDAIRQHSASHVELGYREARQAMFADIDNQDGQVTEVYSGRSIETQNIPDARGREGVNTEHTRPKSTGVRDTAAVSDLHHLFPTDTQANAKRSSFPFGEVERVTWQKGDSKLGFDKDGRQVFEPPDAHKGNVARSQFYVSTIYGLEVSKQEEVVLKSWNKLDPVDSAEQQRNADISAYQENRNPFVDDASLAERIDDF